MKRITPVLTYLFLALGTSLLLAQEVTNEGAYRAYVPFNWVKTTNIPQGFDAGFRKTLSAGKEATIFLHYTAMPPEAGEPPSDTSAMTRQWDVMIQNQFPGARSVFLPPPQVHGRILINAAYTLKDSGSLVERRYTYFFFEHTAFVVQCTAPPEEWASVLHDFDAFVLSLTPRSGQAEGLHTSDNELLINLRKRAPALVASWPPGWRCSVTDIAISNVSQPADRSLYVSLSFNRSDIGSIYRATKAMFTAMRQGEGQDPLHTVAPDSQSTSDSSAEFISLVGQVWGYAYGEAFDNDPPVGRFRVIIEDANKQRVGAITISKTDASILLSGKVNANDRHRISSLYAFE